MYLCCMQYVSNRKFPHAQNPPGCELDTVHYISIQKSYPNVRNYARWLKTFSAQNAIMKRESLTHFPDHRRCLIIPRTEVQLLFHLSNEPCVTFQWIVSTWTFRCAGKRRWALVYGSSDTQIKKRDEHRSVPVDSVFSRVLTRCWCGAVRVR